MIEKSNSQLSKAQALYTKRQLDEALQHAQRALEATPALPLNEQIQTHLLLGNIFYTKGKYLGDNTLFDKAFQHIQQASQISHNTGDIVVTITVLLAFAAIYQSKKEYTKASQHLSFALETSEGHLPSKIRTLCKTSQFYILKNDSAQALQYAQEAQKLLDTTIADDNKPLALEVYSQLSQANIRRRDIASILDSSHSVLSLSQELDDAEREATALKNIAIAHGYNSNYKMAMQYFLEALEKSQAINYRNNTAQCLINIGTIYAELFNYEDALTRYQTVLEEYPNTLDTTSLIAIHNNIGNIYYSSERPSMAEPYFKKALRLAKQAEYLEMQAHALAQLGRSKASQQQFDEAFAFANEAQQLIEQLGDINGKQINLVNLGDMYCQLKKYKQAENQIHQGIQAAQAIKDNTSKIKAYKILANIYQAQSKFEQAFEYQLMYDRAKETFSKERQQRQLIDLEIKYAIQEKQKEIEQLAKENQYQSLLIKQSEHIARQNAQLLQANEELRQFAYVASHDLKEPLRMIGSYTQLINKRYAETLPEDSTLYFNFISEGVSRMNSLLDALLKYATVGKSEEAIEYIGLTTIVDICKVHLKLLIEESQATITHSALPSVYSAQSLLIQLLQNLISNAIKFKKPDVPPTVHISAQEDEANYIISVQDNGIGIAAEFQSRIFEIFQRLHGRQKYKGTGIGLAICQKILKRLGGRIWITSELGHGATFSFSLPKEPPKEEEGN